MILKDQVQLCPGIWNKMYFHLMQREWIIQEKQKQQNDKNKKDMKKKRKF